MSNLAVSCGRCHEATGKAPVFSEDAVPADREGLGWHMARHRWAADRMWEGLITPSDLAWQLGIAELAEEPIASHEATTAGKEMTTEAADMGKWLHDMGKFGGHMPDAEARARFYGDFIATCAGCHSEALSL